MKKEIQSRMKRAYGMSPQKREELNEALLGLEWWARDPSSGKIIRGTKEELLNGAYSSKNPAAT